MSLKSPIVISGAGIGGLTLAQALKSYNLPFALYEQTPELLPIGAGITIQSNATKILEPLNLIDPIVKAGTLIHELHLHTHTGKLLNKASLEKRSHPTVGIHRGKLQQILSTGLESLNLGNQVTGFSEINGQPLLHTNHNKNIPGCLGVAADGIHSAIRKQMTNDTLRYSGYTSWRGICKDPGNVLERHLAIESWGPGIRLGRLYIDHDHIYWYATHNQPSGETLLEPKAFLNDLFQEWDPKVIALIEATEESQIIQADIFDRKPIQCWHSGNVLLLGDAAHPMTPNMGQGGCQAIEDAMVLAQAIKDHAPNMNLAIQTYEHERVKRANWFVTRSFRIGQMGQLENKLLRWMRDLSTQLTPFEFIMPE